MGMVIIMTGKDNNGKQMLRVVVSVLVSEANASRSIAVNRQHYVGIAQFGTR